MIFVTIGSMFPFDRLIRAMDAWAEARDKLGEADEILAQIGAGDYVPAHMRHVRKLPQTEFARTVETADLVVAHAGMGSVITASQYGKPIVMMPRLQQWGEHTTDHQLATANWLRGKPGVYIADDEADLAPCIARALEAGRPQVSTFPQEAPPQLITQLRACIFGRS